MITLKNVSFAYALGEEENGLKNINLTVGDGEVVLLCGESGCGKTTLTRLINGLIPHYYEGSLTGEVIIDGKEIHRLPLYETARLVGSVFQNPRSQFFNVDTTGELAFGGENLGMPAEEIEERIRRTVGEFNMDHLLERNLFQLSGGEKQKIACASVSVCEPEILVLDEPSSNLDMAAIEDLRRLIRLWKSKGKTIVIAEHRLYFLRELWDRVIVMKKGCIEREYTPSQFNSLSGDALSGMGLRPLYLRSLKGKSATDHSSDEKVILNHFLHLYDRKGLPALKIDMASVPRGGIIAVIGLNGAGKSTFARCLCGLEKRCKGTLSIDGRHLSSRQRLKRCYMVMQDVNHQLFTESVLDEVLLSMAGEDEDEEQAHAILNSLDLLSMKERHPHSLSGGQKQRTAIAGALASKRDIVLFDEPTSGLDLKHMKEVSQRLRELSRTGKTLFIISHDLELILWSCTHVLHLEKGTLLDSYPLDSPGVEKLKSFFIYPESEADPVRYLT